MLTNAMPTFAKDACRGCKPVSDYGI
uniref:Uracil-DNA glycosylase n=1 Tax=Heterorhabditis bacteriophora TaxID=37862 RepID=A0A1I7X4U2_HETBA